MVHLQRGVRMIMGIRDRQIIDRNIIDRKMGKDWFAEMRTQLQNGGEFHWQAGKNNYDSPDQKFPLSRWQT